MKNLIRNILRESSGDFDWMREIPMRMTVKQLLHEYYHLMKEKQKNYGSGLKVKVTGRVNMGLGEYCNFDEEPCRLFFESWDDSYGMGAITLRVDRAFYGEPFPCWERYHRVATGYEDDEGEEDWEYETTGFILDKEFDEDLVIEFFEEGINESTNDFDWVDDIDEFDYLENTAFEFSPPYLVEDYYESEDPYVKLFDFFIKLGLKPIYHTPRDVSTYTPVSGLYVHGDNFVYSPDIGEEDYSEHIEHYAIGEGIRIKPKIVDAIQFIKDMGL